MFELIDDGGNVRISAPEGVTVVYGRGARWTTTAGVSASFQVEGTLALFSKSGRKLWSSPNDGKAGAYLSVRHDGQLDIYDVAGRIVWSAGNLRSPGSYLSLQCDGNLVLYGSAGEALWASGTQDME